MDNIKELSRLMDRDSAVRLGVGDGQLRQLVASRQLVRLRRGSYLGADVVSAMDDEQRHAMNIQAALAAQHTRSVVSYQSAAVLHGLALWSVDLGAVHLNKLRRNAGRGSSVLQVHSAPLDAADIIEVGGVAVTSVARTVFDIATAVPFEQAVVVADAALFKRLTSPEELAEMVRRNRGRHGREAASLAIEFANGLSQSVGESRSRVGMHQARLPAPVLQHPVCDADGSVFAHADFEWDWLLGEFDGLVKYGRLRKPGEDAGAAVVREKLREDGCRDVGYDMIRWTWAQLSSPGTLWPRVRERIARTERRLGRRH